MTLHWHAFDYTGSAFSDSQIRKGEAPSRYPPIEIKHWLTRRNNQGRIPHVAVFTESNVEQALAWLEKELIRQKPLDADAFPIAKRLEYSRAKLLQEVNRDVVYGYWSTSLQYVSRALILCNLQDASCQ